ncbi:MAG TPA: hypothetical protein V6D26_26330 [Stenomitos sp.]
MCQFTLSIHKFRGAYFRACVQNASVDPYDWEDYAKQVLGDDDSATIKAYKRFVLKPGSITVRCFAIAKPALDN